MRSSIEQTTMGLLKKIKHKTHHHSPPSIPTPHFDPPHINPPKVPAAIIKTPIAINYGAKVVKQNVDHTITETKSETLTIVDAIKSTAVKLVDKVSGDKKNIRTKLSSLLHLIIIG